MTMLYKYAAMNNREIGDLLDVDYSTVIQGRSRLRKRLLKKNISDCWYGGLNNCVKDKDLTLQRPSSLRWADQKAMPPGTQRQRPARNVTAG
jgi:hypothetical protein